MRALEVFTQALAQGDTEPLIRWIWITDHLDEIVSRGLQHVYLTVVTVLIGFLIAFPAAVFAARHRWAVSPITSRRSVAGRARARRRSAARDISGAGMGKCRRERKPSAEGSCTSMVREVTSKRSGSAAAAR